MSYRAFLLWSFILPLLPEVHATDRNPQAAPRATVTEGNARFTLLTPRLIRMEWAEDGTFEDRATLTFVHRALPVPEFRVKREHGVLTITTSAATLAWTAGPSRFDSSNLRVHFAVGGMQGEWSPGKADPGNLLGTTRTLDGFDGEWSTKDSSRIVLEPGLLSTSGWTLVDDSDRPVFDRSDWPWVAPRTDRKHQDLYLFVYGRDYKSALGDFISVAGRIPLPPRFAFGYWYSRWRASSEMELRELVNTFESLDVPLDVLVVDMDWHITALPEFFDGDRRRKDQAGEDCGWTGFTWNTSMFPDPEGFLAWADRKGLQTSLNLHPASGIQPHESQYADMARATGIDPATNRYVPFAITDKHFAQKYFDLVLRPMEKQGIDFWWLDWQQWNTTAIKGVNPTFYLNYVHFTDMERQNRKRPLIYHRWGGLGNHRYQIGFSGDTKISWASLDFQPYFTSTAANVGFGYWGNDIGGFFGTPNTPEQFTRWFQFGVFSPILKTHATGRDFSILRKLWEYPPETFLYLRELLHLRYALIPYLYTAARTAYDTGVSPCHPLYYEYPDRDEAYLFRNQYFFGPDMIVHPITRPIGSESLYTVQTSWLPPGEWFEWSSGTLLKGDTVLGRPYRLREIPVFVRSGAIIPMQARKPPAGQQAVDPLVLTIFPGARGNTRVYEDEGNTNAYQRGSSAFTPVRTKRHGRRITVTIGPMQGSFPGMPKARRYELRFVNSYPVEHVTLNGSPLRAGRGPSGIPWTYNGAELTSSISVPSIPTDQTGTLTITFSGNTDLFNGQKRRLDVLYHFSTFLSDRRNFRRQDVWSDARYSSDLVMRAAQTSLRITATPNALEHELDELGLAWPRIVDMVTRLAAEKPVYSPYLGLFRAVH